MKRKKTFKCSNFQFSERHKFYYIEGSSVYALANKQVKIFLLTVLSFDEHRFSNFILFRITFEKDFVRILESCGPKYLGIADVTVV